jgi:hypothetical protein
MANVPNQKSQFGQQTLVSNVTTGIIGTGQVIQLAVVGGVALSTLGAGTVVAAAPAAAPAAPGAAAATGLGGGGVTLAQALANGLVRPGGTLAKILSGMETNFGTIAPKTAFEALNVVQKATSGARVDIGVATTVTEAGEIVLSNVGGVTTTIGTNGSILVQRGADVLLHLLP